MNKTLIKIFGVAALTIAAATTARGEIVENYHYDFKKEIDRNDPAFAVASGWGHVVDTYNATGSVIKQNYSQSSYSGHNDCGRIDISSHLLGNIYTCNDMIVTPKVSGAVSLWCKSNLYNASGTIRFYALKLRADGTYEIGEEYTGQANSDLPFSNNNDWVEIAFPPIAEDAEYPHIGIHGNNVRISDFNAAKAEIPKVHKLSIKSVSADGSYSGIVCDENNMASVTLSVSLLNLGDFSYDGTEENLTVSISLPGAASPLKTFDIGAIDEGASKNLKCALDPIPFSDLGPVATFVVTDNFTGATATSPEVKIKEYKAVISFREDSYTDLKDDYVLDFGRVNATSTRNMYVLATKGTAPAIINGIKCPEGFSANWELPKTIPTSGKTEITFTFDPQGMQPGVYSGNIEFTVSNGDLTVLQVRAEVLDPALIYIPFTDNSAIPSEIVNGTGNNAWKLSYSGSGSNRNNYLQPTSSWNEAELTLPKLTFPADANLTIDARSDGSSAKIKFAYSPDRTAWTELPDATLTTSSTPALTSDFQTFEIKGIPAGDYFLKITGSNVYIDNIYGLPYAKVAHDMSITATIPPTAMVNNLFTAKATLKNFNMTDEDAEGYKLVLTVNGEEHEANETVTVPGKQGTAELSISFTPHAAGEVNTSIEVRFADGETMATPETTVTVVKERIDARHTIAPAASQKGSQYVLPLSVATKVLSEQIYPASYINLPAGTVINGISFSGYTTMAYSAHIEAWVALTDKTRQNADKTPVMDVETLTKMFDGDYTFSSSSTSDWFLNLPFNEEFVYDGTSSIVVYLRATTPSKTYTFNFYAYNNGDPDTRFLNYARWTVGDDGSLGDWANHCIGHAALNLVVEAGKVTGHVMEGELPVGNAAVTLRSDNVEYYGTSDDEGAFSIEVLQTSRDYTVTAAADNFKANEGSVSFLEGNSQNIDIAMLTTRLSLSKNVYASVTLHDTSLAPAGTYYRFDSVNGNELQFRLVESPDRLEAGVPYIILPEADCIVDLSTLDFSHQPKSVTKGATSFHGIYASRVLNEAEYLPTDLIADSPSVRPASSADNRKVARAPGAYIATDIVNPVTVLIHTVTGIENVKSDTLTDSVNVYTIDGRRINVSDPTDGLPAGIYIINGKKVAIR